MAGGAGADRGGRGRAAGQPRADGVVQEQTRVVNQMRGWLATWGATLPSRRRRDWWTTVRDWAGARVAREVQARLARAEARLAMLERQLAELDAQQKRP